MISKLTKKNLERYSRQIILKSIGPLGQKKIINSKVLIVGAGGLGCPIADYLSRAGVGEIGIADDDKVNISNIHRQSMYYTDDINRFKVDVLKDKISKINSSVKVKRFKIKINKYNIEKIIKNYEIIIDGSDNFKTKFLLNDYCMVNKKKLIIGAISKYEGHIFSFDFKKRNIPCLKCFYQEMPSDENLDCESEGVIGPIAGIVGSIQAYEVLKNIINFGKNITGKILIIDLLSYNFRTAIFAKKKMCSCKN